MVHKSIDDESRSELDDEAALPGEIVYELIESAMSEDDANDPGLDLYQKYKQ